MTSTELERLIREKLGAVGLSACLNEQQSQFLEFPDGLFAELVVNDGSRLVEIERIAREVRESLRKRRIALEVVVRAVWSVEEVHHGGKALSATTPGAFRDAEAFMATLVSGAVRTTVEVDVTGAAWDEIERETRKTKGSVNGVEAVKGFVEQFLNFRLSLGGANYWDPGQYAQLTLGPEEVGYLLGRSPAVQS